VTKCRCPARTTAGDRRARGGTRLTAREIHQNILRPAEQEIRRPAAALLWSALASGLVIGFSPLAAAFAAQVASEPYARAAAAAAYPLGFIFVIMARSELFTENTLVPVIPFLIWLCTAPIAALHFRHLIAESVEAFYRAGLSDASWGGMLGGFVVPSVLGNAIGGVLLVALLNYSQVAAGRQG
jgi:formate/nitrite transporter FocA (FNT family)